MESVEPMASAPALASGDTAAPTERKADAPDSAVADESPRLFIVCGRDRKVEDVRELFARCGAIRQLHIATDRCNKSRGFAFLQYEDAASATDAIKQFDKTTLSDGHVLKVTVAREKSRATASAVVKAPTTTNQPGKLKRNQHSQEDSNEKGEETSATDSGAFSGKRQRSSPPTTVASGNNIQKIWKRTSPFASLAVATRSAEDEIADVLGGIIAQIERQQSEETGDDADKATASVTVVAASASASAAAPAAAKRKAPMALALTTGDHAEKRPAIGETSAARVDCENVRPCKQKSQRTTAAQATPNRLSRDALFLRQRRHVAVDESDSSLDDASDASVGRRKRNSTEPDEPGKSNEPTAANAQRRLSDLSELSLSPAGISSPMTSKKRCSRRSSASSSSSLPPYQASAFRHVAPIFVPAMPPTIMPPPMRRRRNGPRAKLFFTSTVKFTIQELEAMFSIYEQFEHVQVVKSFGRLKTMAYVKYTSPEAAGSVLSSFLDDNEGEDHGMIKLVYADTDEPTPRLDFQASSNRHMSSSAAGESTSSAVVARPHEAAVTPPVQLASDTNCWLMILYDRGLTNDAISSCATACEGMEFVDIKMFRSTGESQGVAFVKFETEEFAQAASRQLHNSEFPVGSRKFLQAIVISDPALFSTPHGACSSEGSVIQSSLQAPSSSAAHHPGEDGDLGFVEARFAHLMSGGGDQPSGSVTPMPDTVSANEGYGDQDFFSGPRPEVFMGTNTFAQHPGVDGPAPYGYFQFGQPYPFTAESHNHLPHSYRQHHPSFFPPDAYGEQPPWGYEAVYPMWPGEGGSPMPPSYNPYSWEPVSNAAGFNSAASAQPDVTSVFVSSSRPLDLSSLLKAIQECPGVVGFSKEEREGVAFVVDFGEQRLAVEAANKLDGTMCNGNKLRVAVASGHRAPPSRRKRQRLDQRERRK